MDKFGHQISANTTNYPHTNVFSEAVRSLVNMMDQKFCRGQARNNPKSFTPKSCSIDSASPPRSFAARGSASSRLGRKLVILRNRDTPLRKFLRIVHTVNSIFPKFQLDRIIISKVMEVLRFTIFYQVVPSV